MKKFFALYMIPAGVIEQWMKDTTPEQRDASMAEWGKWMEDNKASFVDAGSMLGKTKKITSEGVSDLKNDITGYSIVQAESHDEAAKIFASHPNNSIPGGWIELMSVTEMESK